MYFTQQRKSHIRRQSHYSHYWGLQEFPKSCQEYRRLEVGCVFIYSRYRAGLCTQSLLDPPLRSRPLHQTGFRGRSKLSGSIPISVQDSFHTHRSRCKSNLCSAEQLEGNFVSINLESIFSLLKGCWCLLSPLCFSISVFRKWAPGLYLTWVTHPDRIKYLQEFPSRKVLMPWQVHVSLLPT